MTHPEASPQPQGASGEILKPDSIIERLPSGLELIRREHPLTGQQLLVMAPPEHSNDPHYPPMQDTERLAEEFNDQTRGQARRVEVIIEGRVPAVVHNGELFDGDRMPPVDSSDRALAVATHSEWGLLACIGRENGWEVKSGDNDLAIILQLEADGIPRLDILRYLIARQLPQWSRMEKSKRPPLGRYLLEDAILRYDAILADHWEDYADLLFKAYQKDLAGIMAIIDVQPENTEPLLNQTIGHMFGKLSPEELANPGPITRVSMAYNPLRDKYFSEVLTGDWGGSDTPHRITTIGQPHLRALVPDLAALK